MAGTDERIIDYRFVLKDGDSVRFTLVMDAETMLLKSHLPGPAAPWTRLAVKQCPNCPLDAATHSHCPAAIRLEPVLKAFNRSNSFDPVTVTVVTGERTVSHATTIQKSLSSLIGLIFPTSGCPRLAPFRPMARFHLPLATVPETLFRSSGMYLLAQYFRHKAGAAADWDMAGLARIYRHLETVNAAMSERLRAASETDSSVNAVILLDMLAKILPDALDDALEELRPLFSPLPGFHPHQT
ncbi:MAG: hypothetical protein ABIL58_21975 [Pseudomonadota bacterium]